MADFKPIRSLEENVSDIPHSDGQFILTNTGNIYVDMPNEQRTFIRGASIPIVLTRAQYEELIEKKEITVDGNIIPYEEDRIYMIRRTYTNQ